MKIATRANQVCALRSGDKVNILLHYMIPSGEGFRHVPLLDGDGKPIGVFLLKHVLNYSLLFLERGDDTTLLNLGLRDLKGRVVARNATIADAIEFMNRYRRRCIFVVDSVDAAAYKACGMLSEWDLIDAILVQGLEFSTPVEKIMTRQIESCDLNESVLSAAKTMLELNHHQLMVTCQEHLVGIVSLRKILDHIAEFFPAEVHCLEPRYPVGTQRFCTREGA
jgi:CBS domain-containing protein